jgi:surface protein
MSSGTFSYQFDFSESPPVDVSSNLPIINGDGSFTTLTPSYNVLGNTMTVNIIYVFVDNGTTNDGLSFNNLATYYNQFTNLTITVFGDIPLSRGAQQFRGLNSLIFTATNPPTILSNTSFQQCFYQSATFNSDISNWNVSNVTNMAAMFQSVSSFNQNITGWNVSNVTDMNSMFHSVPSFNQNISGWNVNRCQNFTNMFFNAIKFNQPIGAWTLNTVTPISMQGMFGLARDFNQPLSSWNVIRVTTTNGMFYGATSFNQNLSSWNVSNVRDMNGMFDGATSFSPSGTNTYLDQMLNSWALLSVRSTVILAAPQAYYSASGVDSYNTLVNSYGWTINANRAPPPICFLEGSTLLSFINGKEEYVPIENIRNGTLVKTYLHGYVPVHIIGHSKIYNSGDKLRGKNRLYRLTKDSYPDLTDDLIITGCHSLLVDKLSEKQKSDIIDELGRLMITDGKYRLMAIYDERAETYEDEGLFNIWHLALEHDDERMNYGVYANGGLLVETTSQRMLANFSGMTLV